MRDPQRIEQVLLRLRWIWEKQPDTRFFQLVHNLQMEYKEKHGWVGSEVYQKAADVDSYVMFEKKVIYDFYSLEDEGFLEFLKQKYEEEN